ncbi:fasciclin-like arabinogalactan protein [Trifolium pratense]|uniref:Fasciclin-like arabinogalactan protein n=1 Tax=Trifolium pratense TaxID=57577 RepID=A0A2K3KZV3_TRIPR|nr:fasciclin-like arabinogalactan protein [Trifolium pratense]
MKKQFFFSASILQLLIFTFFYSTTTTSAQLSPVQAPQSSSPAPGFNTVPLVPVSPSGAPTPNIIPKTPSIDIIQILKKGKRFSVLIRLLKTTQLINQLNSQLVTTSTSSDSGGLTLFAPEDSAFTKLKPGFLNSLSDRHKVELLQFHTLSSFVTISNFDTLTNPVQTQAGDDAKRLQLNVTTSGSSHVSMTTGAVNATVTGTVYADNKLGIYQVDKVLVPLDLVLPPAKAPAPAPVSKGDSSKPDDRSKSSSSFDDDENNNLPAKASSGAGSSNMKGMWIALVVGIAFAWW